MVSLIIILILAAIPVCFLYMTKKELDVTRIDLDRAKDNQRGLNENISRKDQIISHYKKRLEKLDSILNTFNITLDDLEKYIQELKKHSGNQPEENNSHVMGQKNSHAMGQNNSHVMGHNDPYGMRHNDPQRENLKSELEKLQAELKSHKITLNEAMEILRQHEGATLVDDKTIQFKFRNCKFIVTEDIKNNQLFDGQYLSPKRSRCISFAYQEEEFHSHAVNTFKGTIESINPNDYIIDCINRGRHHYLSDEFPQTEMRYIEGVGYLYLSNSDSALFFPLINISLNENPNISNMFSKDKKNRTSLIILEVKSPTRISRKLIGDRFQNVTIQELDQYTQETNDKGLIIL